MGSETQKGGVTAAAADWVQVALLAFCAACGVALLYTAYSDGRRHGVTAERLKASEAGAGRWKQVPGGWEFVYGGE